MKYLLLILFIAMGVQHQAFAQSWDDRNSSENLDSPVTISDTYRGYPQRPFHVGVVYPLSSNGVAAADYVNKVSIHLFAGVERGLNGVAFSGLANVDVSFVEGVQFAGITNVNAGDLLGAQLAGIANVNAGYAQGLQMAGIANVNGDSAVAGQFAGIVNINAGSLTGAQFAGIANVNTTFTDGGQFAGVLNISPGAVSGIQAAGVANYASEIQGTQLAAVINVAGKVRGAQIGLLNIADSVDGVSIGFLSLVRHGYHRLEFSGSEALHTQMAIKLGVQHFYNIFSVGYHLSGNDPLTYGEEPTWAYGYGVGAEFNLGPTWRMNIDLTTFDVIEKENTFTNKKLNLLNQFRLNFGAQFGRSFTLVFGPSFNVMVSQLSGSDGFNIGSDIAPWTVYDRTHDGTNVKMWPGANIAIRF
ncbi:hypothetical protein [Fulvivirga sedimenti]|uniref:DUF5723 domain-containing protein n=1 Tax=Fulvivirga sedimenti TaxID=2879465 RepID=A0A9X1HYB9_9BACT|nr:hypothetical protein [Fulvivirga sedimenti]MCA6078787.1 hypothetical protein [Fulvivirga sedimenti]